eukprot:CAMPEP_0113577444 /NCGR_PEP_ID=MMETSP0015_2-20120614/28885_1 /TAXON_ID=2838 /ORGANISM="Odontella" /LENGTH=241 /DNA_ID=CAMNT_0000481051 /DNA_START=186 /DNA_END=907 /DNA_ORIENTATION=+ /assembly_acc=CAM_ASM_000160
MAVRVRAASYLALLAASALTSDSAAGLSLPGRLLSRRVGNRVGRDLFGESTSEIGGRIIAAPPESDGRDDDFLMGLALDEARRAAEAGEVPIGAIIVRPAEGPSPDPPDRSFFSRRGVGDEPKKKSGSGGGDGGSHPTTYYEVLSSAHNLVETTHDASAHAELLSLRSAASATTNWRLLNCTLYSTLEPCPMCLSAAQAFRVDRVVYGAPDLRLGAVESYMTMLEENVHPYHGGMKVKGGV